MHLSPNIIRNVLFSMFWSYSIVLECNKQLLCNNNVLISKSTVLANFVNNFSIDDVIASLSLTRNFFQLFYHSLHTNIFQMWALKIYEMLWSLNYKRHKVVLLKFYHSFFGHPATSDAYISKSKRDRPINPGWFWILGRFAMYLISSDFL